MNIAEISSVVTVHLPLTMFFLSYLAIGVVSLYCGRRSSSQRLKEEEPYRPFVSVVMPVYNEEEIIASRLDGLLKTTYPKDRMEVLIVDSSDDNTTSIIESYSRRYPMIRLLHDTERRGVATALNQALRVCKGEIFVKVDSDLFLADNIFDEAISHFRDPRIGAVAAKLNVANQAASREVRYRVLQETIQKAETYIDSVFMAHPFAAYRKHLMKEYKPKEYGDETTQTIHIRRQGYKVIYDPKSNFYEHFPENAKERLRQKVRRSEGLIRIIIENSDMLFNPRYGKFGMYVFPSNLFMFIISPILLLLTLIVSVLDLALFSATTYLDVSILVLLAAAYLGRRQPVVSSIWTFVELQYAQLRGLLNVVARKGDNKWRKIDRVSVQQS